MNQPESDADRGLLIALYVLAAGGLMLLILTVGSLWPAINALFS